jgi:ribosome biogenesis protein Nip4
LEELACLFSSIVRNESRNILWKIMKTYLVISSHDDEEPFGVEAETREEAIENALRELGWYVIQEEEDEDTDLPV